MSITIIEIRVTRRRAEALMEFEIVVESVNPILLVLETEQGVSQSIKTKLPKHRMVPVNNILAMWEKSLFIANQICAEMPMNHEVWDGEHANLARTRKQHVLPWTLLESAKHVPLKKKIWVTTQKWVLLLVLQVHLALRSHANNVHLVINYH
jgi:hypothetical protein